MIAAMAFNPDLGLRIRKDGMGPHVKHFYDVPLYGFTAGVDRFAAGGPFSLKLRGNINARPHEETQVKRFPELDDKSQRGSKPRCHLLTDGSRAEVAGRLTGLMKPYGSVSRTYSWVPNGFEYTDEVQLQKPNAFITDEISRELENWWFEVHGGSGPTWDLVSQCVVGSSNRATRRGILLVEAKAHWAELERERGPKKLSAGASHNSHCNHDRIGNAIEEANAGLKVLTNVGPWALSRDNCYQMANRFAWAWKLVDLGVPVILVYLGFLDASEMSNVSNPFSDHSDWVKCVKTHAKDSVPEEAWERCWKAPDGAALVPRIMSVRQSLTAARVSP